MRGTRLVLCLAFALPACAALLDLPSPVLDETVTGPDGSTSNIDGATPDGAAPNGDGSSPAEDGATTSDARAPLDAGTCDADTKTSLEHCGACFHDCTGGQCENGLCLLAADSNPPSANLRGADDLAILGDQFFFGTSGGQTGVYSCSKKGCLTAGPKRLNTDTDSSYSSVNSVVAYGAYVYWAEYYNYKTFYGAYRTPINGGPSTRVSTGDQFHYTCDIAVSDAGIAWANAQDGERLAYCPLGLCSGAATLVPGTATGNSSAVVFAPDNSLVWSEGSSILTCATPACPSGPTVLVDLFGWAYALTVVGNVAYWGSISGDDIRSCPLSGCGKSATTVIAGQSEGSITSLTEKDGSLFWTVGGTPNPDGGQTVDGVVRTCSIGSCAATVRDIAVKQPSPRGIAVDDRSIFWVNQGRVSSVGGSASAYKAPR